VRLPVVGAAPSSWCSCAPRPDPACRLHARCDECERSGGECDCDWWYDQHFCRSCGLELWNCDCNHMAEITEKLYEF